MADDSDTYGLAKRYPEDDYTTRAIASDVSYTTTNSFLDLQSAYSGDDTLYEWPYCPKDETYYTQFVLVDHKTDFDDKNQCSIYEHRSVNYPRCAAN